MRTRNLIYILALIANSAFAQSDTDAMSMTVTLTHLSQKAQENGDYSALMVYQNAFYELKEDYPQLMNDFRFIQADQFFEQVCEANKEALGVMCFDMDGPNNSAPLGDVPSGEIAVVTAPGQNFWYMEVDEDLFNSFDSGIVQLDDVRVMATLNSNINNNTPVKLEPDQIKRITAYYDLVGNSIFKNTQDNTYVNSDAFKSRDMNKLMEYRTKRIEFKKINNLQQQQILNPDAFNRDQPLNNRRLNQIRSSMEQINNTSGQNNGGR